MHIAYVTTDQVNPELALQMAEALGATLDIVWPRDSLAGRHFDALVFDLDFLPSEYRKDLFRHHLPRFSALPMAVHSYSLSSRQRARLRKHGVLFSRRLKPALLERLKRAFDQRLLMSIGRQRSEVR